MHHPSVMPFSVRKKHGWMEQKMHSKESAFLRERLKEIKNRYIKEGDVWRQFFLEINNYIGEEIAWIGTLT